MFLIGLKAPGVPKKRNQLSIRADVEVNIRFKIDLLTFDLKFEIKARPVKNKKSTCGLIKYR